MYRENERYHVGNFIFDGLPPFSYLLKTNKDVTWLIMTYDI
jgi:hypothetical protein